MTTRSSFRSSVQLNLGERTDLNSQIDEGLNQGLKIIGERHDFKGMISSNDVSVYDITLAFTDGSWETATKTLTKTGAFASYTFTTGDKIYITAGTNVTANWHTVASRSSDNAIVLSTEITSDSSDQTDIAATFLGQAGFVDIPSGYSQLIEARIIDGTSSQKITIYPKSLLTERYPYPEDDTMGKPLYGYEEGNDLFLYPWSDSNYTIRLTISSLPTMSGGDSDEPTVNGLDNMLIHYATSYAFSSQEQFDSADRWMMKFEGSLINAIKSDRKKPGMVYKAQPHGSSVVIHGEYWNDPFIKRNP